MQMSVCFMKIVKKIKDAYLIEVMQDIDITILIFLPDSKKIVYLQADRVSRFLRDNEDQFKKILQSMRKSTFYEGFELKIVLRDKKDVTAFNDKTRIIVLDKRYGKNKSYVTEKGEDIIPKVYTDGSYSQASKKGGYAILVENAAGEYSLYSGVTQLKNSNLIELLAVIKGLEILAGKEKIRIVTDSIYVRKGLTERIYNWKLNDWHTANGEKVKHIDYWKRVDALTQGKYLEFAWIKGHSDHFENTICHLCAREKALSP